MMKDVKAIGRLAPAITACLILALACGDRSGRTKHPEGSGGGGGKGADETGVGTGAGTGAGEGAVGVGSGGGGAVGGGGGQADAVTGASSWKKNYAPPPPAGPDNDADGIPDLSDLCPNDPEDKDNFEDANGCPDVDNDKDGIPDASDKCPNEAETYNGKDDEDGCPDFSNIKVEKDPAPGYFAFDVLTFERSDPLIAPKWKQWLDTIAQVVTGNPQILRIEAAVYTDPKGLSSFNLKTSKERADAVVAYLVEKGVDPKILSAAGYGEECPAAAGNAKKGDAKDRRLEFKILETTAGCTKVPFACDSAVKQGLVPVEDKKYLSDGGYCK